MNKKIPRLNKRDLTGKSVLIWRKYQRLFSVIVRSVLFVLLTAGVLGFGESVGAAENLDEMETRDIRRSSNAFYKGLDLSPEYFWQPMTVTYEDLTTGHEIWRITNCPEGEHGSISEEYGYPSIWSADGKRLAIGIDTARSSAYTKSESGRQDEAWFTLLSDYTKLRIAEDYIMRTREHRYQFGWSQAEPDIAYQVGTNRENEGNSNQYVYKAIISDGDINLLSWVDLGSTGDRSIDKSIAPDGQVAVVMTWSRAQPFYSITLLPEINKGVDSVWNLDSSDRNWDTYWGNSPAFPTSAHNARLTGSLSNGYWFFVNLDRQWWRLRLIGSGDDGGPTHVQDTTTPYAWWEGISTQTEMQPVGVNQNNDPNTEGECDLGGLGPWCCDNDESTECDSYWSHPYQYADGELIVYNPYWDPPFVYDIDNTKYIPSRYTGAGSVSSAQHLSWQAFSDWAVEWPGIGNNPLNIFNAWDDTSHVISYTHEEGSGDDEGGIQSPDGTKVAWGSSFLQAGSGWEYNDVFVTTAYHPYPPELTQITASSGTTIIRFDWGLDTENPRGYTTRGWPNEDTDNPPPPRETEKFRLWRSPDNTNWQPIGTVDANIFDRYDFSNGNWIGNNYWTIADTPGDGTWYYAVTSNEHSGLESRTLSNIYQITISGGTGTGSQSTAYQSNPGDIDDPDTSDFYNSFTAEHNLTRYYNIYAEDSSTPTVDQTNRIASIPVNSCSGNDCSWVDWLGHTNGTTQYVITAVDTQGQESEILSGVTSTHKKSPATADGQYTIEWSGILTPDLTSPSRSNPQPIGTLTSGTTSTTISLDTDETATCKYSVVANTDYNDMSNVFATTNSTNHSTNITNLADGNSYTYYIRCQDESNNQNPDDFEISFSIASSITYSISNFINLVSNWLKTESGLESDVNGDGVVNTRDLGIMMSNWQE